MEATHLDYLISDDPARVDFAIIHPWLAGSYWSPGISRERVEKAARHSAVVVTALHASKQVGFCRVVSDCTRFAWLGDVFVDPSHRGKGLGRAIVKFALDHPRVSEVSNWLLGTKDAHGVYAPLGFGPPAEPNRIMQLRRTIQP
jgi:GNAT superfamily N-acetyltransferase